MLRTGQRVMVVHVEVRCYVTHWTGGGFTHTAESVFLGVRDSENETLTPECFVAL